jgi:hypothetical protein
MKRWPLFIVLRQSPDWGHLTMSSFEEQARPFCQMIQLAPEWLSSAVRLWDETFAISYFAVRLAMKEIALANFATVFGSQVIDLADALEGRIGKGLYLFTDDDDWIRPDIGDALSEAAARGHSAFIWGSSSFGDAQGEPIKMRALDQAVYTNNYALSEAFFSDTPERLRSVYQHWNVKEATAGRSVAEIAEYLTITNKNPSSTVFLMRTLKDGLSREALLERVRDYQRRLAHLNLSPPVEWAAPYMLKVRSFFASVLDSAMA